MLNVTDKLSDSEKFTIILQKYCQEYINQKDLAQEMGIPQQSISDWKKHSRNIRIKNRNAISKKFRLTDMVWLDTFDDAVNFEEQLDNYKIIENISKKSIVEKIETLISPNIIEPINEMTKEEKSLLELIGKEKHIELSNYNLNKMTSASIFKFALELKKRNQIKESLETLQIIETNDGSFKYTFHHQIQHLKAILLSHDTFKDWNQSIDILRLLYVAYYHIEEPEIITLLASNYKRKALCRCNNCPQKWKEREDIDMNLLSSATILYREAYEAKPKISKYYDAINFAYLYKISNSLEEKESTDVELKEIYQELMSQWIVEKSNWWEVSSQAEFLMLLGDIDLAIFKITEFLEEHTVEKFNIETTLRQLEMYLHYTHDAYAQKFYDYLYESWVYIEKI